MRVSYRWAAFAAGAILFGSVLNPGGERVASANVAPTAAQSIRGSVPSEPFIGSIPVERSAAPAVMARVTRSSAHYMPLLGLPVPKFAIPQRISPAALSDLTYYGGPTVRTEKARDIYVNCPSFSGCWGAPGTFLTNLASTSFIHLLDQYTGSTANGRYTYGGGISESYNTSGTLQDQDIYNLVHAAAASRGTGYGAIYHVFLQQGVSQCSQAAGGCYAQQYCAYHGAVDFSDIGHTLYSVEPYQGISGCTSPNGRLADSTNSTLSHEYYETITDPDVQTNVAWYNNTLGEIGDICRNSYGSLSVGGTSFQLQQEYSNRYHRCSFSP